MSSRVKSYKAKAPVFIALLLSMATAKAQNVKRMADGHPDFSGFYNVDPKAGEESGANEQSSGPHVLKKLPDGSILYEHTGEVDAGTGLDTTPADGGPNVPPYKPEYMQKAKAIAATGYGNATKLDPMFDCKPLGVPRTQLQSLSVAFPILQIVQNPDALAILFEASPGPFYRIIYTDGRGHPNDLDTSYMGDSIGHWEGDTLVVDTIGLNDDTWYSAGTKMSGYANIHSEKEHVIERWSRSGNKLTYQATVEDPVMLTRPWVIPPKVMTVAVPGDYLQPEMCNTNDKSHLVSESEKDKYLCNWCNTDTLYGGSEGKTSTGVAIPDNLKDAAKTKATTPNK
jgi:hypothetical protein